ncbi:MAG: hypothetical protein CVV42_13350 [Candidatus Riflebacteria bacterium HGW-Riflebacteria-2]|jgi:hypothetical protein|nr:MAG: hypothetical protein CVV42_13350 [Candidatus Riflebacteria bacterium HGW-Riflebacteria-2]
MNIDETNITQDQNVDPIEEQPAEAVQSPAQEAKTARRKSPPEPDPKDIFFKWIRDNNPLYLLSVALMLAGLYLAGSELEAGQVQSIYTIAGFFAVQNIYEIVMIGMALYLLRNRIQSDHGRLLLILVLVFLGDLTGYQVHISGKDPSVGCIASAIYMTLAALKLFVVLKVLNLKLHSSRAFYIFSAFSLIWIGPKIADYMVNSVGQASIGFFDGSYSYYSLWLAAGLIHLPLIIQNWRKNTLDLHEENEYLGNATSFWRWLIVFPFIVMPIYLYFFAMRDQFRFMDSSISLPAIIASWAVCAAFFAQTIWRRACEEWIGLNIYDSVVMMLFLVATMSFTSSVSAPVVINHILLVAGLAATWQTRDNRINGIGLSGVVLWYTGAQLKYAGNAAVDYGTKLSKTAWAAILMGGSFVLLGLGFLLSLIRNGASKKEN